MKCVVLLGGRLKFVDSSVINKEKIVDWALKSANCNFITLITNEERSNLVSSELFFLIYIYVNCDTVQKTCSVRSDLTAAGAN